MAFFPLSLSLSISHSNGKFYHHRNICDAMVRKSAKKLPLFCANTIYSIDSAMLFSLLKHNEIYIYIKYIYNINGVFQRYIDLEQLLIA